LHIRCIFAAYAFFLHIIAYLIYLRCIFCIFFAFFCIYTQFYCLCPRPGFSARAPGLPCSAWHANGSPGDPPAPLDPSRSNHDASNLGTTTPPAPLKVSSVKTEQWNVVVVAYIYHMQTNSSETRRLKKLQKIVSKQRGPRTNRAASTIDDFTGRLEGGLLMTSPMDAWGQIGTETRSDNEQGCLHYQ
jgi:hypothetical protein